MRARASILRQSERAGGHARMLREMSAHVWHEAQKSRVCRHAGREAGGGVHGLVDRKFLHAGIHLGEGVILVVGGRLRTARRAAVNARNPVRAP